MEATQTNEEPKAGWGDVAAASAQQDPPPRVYTAPVMIKLTPAEIDARLTALGTEIAKEKVLEARKKVAATAHKEQVAHVAKLTDVLVAKQEEQTLEVEEQTEFSTGRVVVRRKDTGEQISERPLTAEERQPSLFAKGEATHKNDATGDLFDTNGQYVGPSAKAEEDDGLDDDADQDDEDADEEV